LFLLDEPTRGLHPDDVDKLLAALERLLAAGHTIVAVEHDLTFIGAADHVLDLGPEAGADGGRIVFAGVPSELAGCQESATGRAIRS
jgi:excinuclease ABC subunit A